MEEEKTQPGGKMLDAIIDLLMNVPIFDQFKGDELRLVSRHMSFIELEKGEILFREGDQGDYICFVAEGALDVVKKTEEGRYVVLATLNRGRSIGEMAVIDDFPRSATVRARKNATLVILTRERFDLILEKHAATGVRILKAIARLVSQNLRKTSSRLADYMLPLG